jgi:hypothetical protein
MVRNTSVAEKPATLPAPKPEPEPIEALEIPTALKPTEAEQAEIRALAKRKKVRRRAPRFAVEQGGAQVRIEPAGVHADAAAARVMNAFGITSTDLAERLMTQIVSATHIQPSGTPVSAETLNAALAAVTGIAPRDEAEAMLAAQMVSVHWLAMTMLKRAALDQPSFEIYDSIVNRATKLLRTYTAQLEALKRYRSAGEQRVVVQHQHVNVTADQAAVQVNGGGYPAPGGRGAASETEDQCHASGIHRSVPHEPGAPLLCPDPARDAVPASGGGRPKAVPDARRD